jgi:hypothetical protein
MKEELRLIKQAIGTLQRAVKKQNGFVPPIWDIAEEHYRHMSFRFDLEEWYNHYNSNGWMVGKNKMKDWKACMAQWEARHKKKNPRATTKQYDAYGREIKSNGQDLLL